MWKFPLKATSLKFIMCTSIYTFSSSSSFSCPYITRHSNVDLPLFNGFLPGSPVAWSPFPICSFTWSFPSVIFSYGEYIFNIGTKWPYTIDYICYLLNLSNIFRLLSLANPSAYFNVVTFVELQGVTKYRFLVLKRYLQLIKQNLTHCFTLKILIK